MFKIYENNKLIKETSSGVLCAMYQAFKDHGYDIDTSLNNAEMLHDIWIKLDYPIDVNRLVDFINNNKIDLYNVSYHQMMEDFNESELMFNL